MSRRRRRNRRNSDGLHPDQLYRKAHDPGVPNDERVDADQQLQKSYIPSLPVDPATIAIQEQIIDMVSTGEMEKSIVEANLRGDMGSPLGRRSAVTGATPDIYATILMPNGLINRPQNITFRMLRRISTELPIIQMILSLRRRQMTSYTSIPDAEGKPGFKIVHKDPEHEQSEADLKVINAMETFMLNCGLEEDARKRTRLGRDTFSQFITRVVEDSLILDAVSVETQPNRRGDGISGFYAMDSEFVRLVHPEQGFEGNLDAYLVEVTHMEQPRNVFTIDEAFYYVRNPTSSISRFGYGTPEIERLFRILNAFAMALQYNYEAFNRNQIPRGFLQIFGSFEKKQLQAFRRELFAQMNGLHNRYGYPVLVSPEKGGAAEWTSTNQNFDEMAYARWITLLTSITCALYGVSPEEVNMDSYSTRQAGLGAAKDTTERLASAKDKGFKPFLYHLSEMFNEFLIPVLNKDFRFKWVGIDPRDEDNVAQQKEKVQTVDELRAELGLKPHELEIMGQAPISQAHLMLYQQVAASPEGGGMPPEEGGGPPEEGEEQPPEGEGPPPEGAEQPPEEAAPPEQEIAKARNPFDPSALGDILRY